MKLAFMGTPKFALPTLKGLIESRHSVRLVITQPDKPKGRGMKLKPPPVKEESLKHHIEVWQPERLKGSADLVHALKKKRLDAVIVVAYGQIIPTEMLKIPKYGFINVHASRLPVLRGPAPINWALLSGYTSTGVSIMYLDEGLDTGPVYLDAECLIRDDDDALTLSERLAVLGAQKLLEALDLIEREGISPRPQDQAQATYAPLLKREDGVIDWAGDPVTIHNMIRGLLPWPCAFTRLGEKILRIWKATYIEELHDLKVGTLIKEGRGLRIACRGGFIVPEKVQLEGKQMIDACAFANGLRAEKVILGE